METANLWKRDDLAQLRWFDGSGLDQLQHTSPRRPDTLQRHPEQPVGVAELRPLRPTPQHNALLTEGELSSAGRGLYALAETSTVSLGTSSRPAHPCHAACFHTNGKEITLLQSRSASPLLLERRPDERVVSPLSGVRAVPHRRIWRGGHLFFLRLLRFSRAGRARARYWNDS